VEFEAVEQKHIDISFLLNIDQLVGSAVSFVALTFWSLNFLLNFSTPCISNLNMTETKKGSIMK
jgi:hypothetical protein